MTGDSILSDSGAVTWLRLVAGFITCSRIPPSHSPMWSEAGVQIAKLRTAADCESNKVFQKGEEAACRSGSSHFGAFPPVCRSLIDSKVLCSRALPLHPPKTAPPRSLQAGLF